MHLQRSLGNQAVVTLLTSAGGIRLHPGAFLQRSHTSFWHHQQDMKWLVDKLHALGATDPFGNRPAERARRFVADLESLDSDLHGDERIEREPALSQGEVLSAGDVDYLVSKYRGALGGDIDKARRATRRVDTRLTLVARGAATTAEHREQAGFGPKTPENQARNVASFELSLGEGRSSSPDTR